MSNANSSKNGVNACSKNRQFDRISPVTEPRQTSEELLIAMLTDAHQFQ